MTPALLLSRLAESPCHAITYHRAWCGWVAGAICDAEDVRHIGQRLLVAEGVAWWCRMWGEG